MSISVYRRAFDTYLDQHEKWQALFDVANELSEEVFFTLFRDVLENTSGLYPNAEIIRRMLTQERVNSQGRLSAMSTDYHNWWKRMLRRGKDVRIYRGAGNPNRTGFMWTTNIERATAYAFINGFEQTEVIVGYIKPSRIIIADVIDKDLFVFPEDVDIREFRKLPIVPQGQEMAELRMRIAVALHGANYPLEITPAEFFTKAVEELRIDREETLAFFKAGHKFLEPLGFTHRVATMKTIIEALDVRGA